MRQQYFNILKNFYQLNRSFSFPKKVVRVINNLGNHIKKNLVNGKSAVIYDKYVRSIFIKRGDINFFDEQIIFSGECCPEEFRRIFFILKEKKIKNLIAAGGGKVLDIAKYLKSELKDINLINIPTSAATCAAFTPVSVMYNKEGNYLNTIDTISPDILIIDYGFFMDLPAVFFAAGVMDTIAKYYETEIFYKNENEKNFYDIYTKSMAFILKSNIFRIIKKNKSYLKDKDKFFLADCNIIYSGLISCIGIKTVTASVAHALAHAMTVIPQTRKYLHGEHVAVALLIQEHLFKNRKNIHDIELIINKTDMPDRLSKIDICREDLNLLYSRYNRIKQNEKIYIPVNDNMLYNILREKL